MENKIPIWAIKSAPKNAKIQDELMKVFKKHGVKNYACYFESTAVKHTLSVLRDCNDDFLINLMDDALDQLSEDSLQ